MRYEYLQHNPQETSSVRKDIETINKQIRNAVGFIGLISVLCILLGLIFIIIQTSFSYGMTFGIPNTVYSIAYGMVYLWSTIGISRRSRACVLIVSCLLLADMAYYATGAGLRIDFTAYSVSYYGMRMILIIGLLSGISGSFKYNSLVKKYADTSTREITALIRNSKPGTKGPAIIVRVIVSLIGIGAIVYCFTIGGYAEGRHFDDWIEYTSGAATVRMPSGRVSEDSVRLPDTPGVRAVTAQSNGIAARVVLITYRDMLNYMGLTAKNAEELEVEILDTFVAERGLKVSDRLEGIMAGQVRYLELHIEYEGLPGAVRCFSGGNDIYIAAIYLHNSDNNSLIDRFLNNIDVK